MIDRTIKLISAPSLREYFPSSIMHRRTIKSLRQCPFEYRKANGKRLANERIKRCRMNRYVAFYFRSNFAFGEVKIYTHFVVDTNL